jgi:hypothetical protein
MGGFEDNDCYVYDDNPTITLGARHILRWVLGDDTGLFGDHAERPGIPVDGNGLEGDERESFVQWARDNGWEEPEEVVEKAS